MLATLSLWTARRSFRNGFILSCGSLKGNHVACTPICTPILSGDQRKPRECLGQKPLKNPRLRGFWDFFGL